MKNIIILNKLHSIVDVITNSSTELFICKTDKTLSLVKELLNEMLQLYNKVSDRTEMFDDVFGDIQIIDGNNVDEFINEIVKDWNWIPDEVNIKRPRERVDLSWEDNDKVYNNFVNDNIDVIKQSLLGRIFIYSKEDNSIPYSLHQMIEDGFDAERLHLG